MSKFCYCCDTEKPLREFTRQKNICKICDKVKEAQRQLNTQYYVCRVCKQKVHKREFTIHNSTHRELSNKIFKEDTSFRASEAIVYGGHKFGKNGLYKPYRSKYEYIFALWLQDQNLPIIYEQEYFTLEDYNGTEINYIPDFYLPHKNTYIEIIGNPNRRNNKKAFLFSQQYKFQYKIEIWIPKTFEELELIDRYQRFLPGDSNNV